MLQPVLAYVSGMILWMYHTNINQRIHSSRVQLSRRYASSTAICITMTERHTCLYVHYNRMHVQHVLNGLMIYDSVVVVHRAHGKRITALSNYSLCQTNIIYSHIKLF